MFARPSQTSGNFKPAVFHHFHAAAHNPLVRALRIRRSIADVAYSMLGHHWHYPARLFPETTEFNLALIQGLILAQRALESVPAEQIDFDQIIEDEAPLRQALEAIYNHIDVDRVKYIDEEFRATRDHVVDRRNTETYYLLEDYVATAYETWEKAAGQVS